MQHLSIHRFGPIEHCELDIQRFMVFTGPVSSGKSTAAKCIFFFKNIKNLICMQTEEYWQDQESSRGTLNPHFSLEVRVHEEICRSFTRTFGLDMCKPSMSLSYRYGDGVSVEISNFPHDVQVELSEKITDLIIYFESSYSEEIRLSNERETLIRKQVDSLFGDQEEVFFIPAGRSMAALFDSSTGMLQTLDEDSCTRNFLEMVSRIKPAFSEDVKWRTDKACHLSERSRRRLIDAAFLMKRILRGEYFTSCGEGYLKLPQNRQVRINLASSGQQEAVWLLNILFYQLLKGKKSCFFIEEPESHLFPDAQKLMAEFIALSGNCGENTVILTTHSPYILGTLNNLLFAHKIAADVDRKKLGRIVPENWRLDFDQFSALYFERGEVYPCTDPEFGSIENEVIDEASIEINKEFGRMLELQEEAGTAL